MKKHRILTTSNVLTILRIVLTPFVVVAVKRAAWGWACGLFAAAALTDLLDGYLARFLDEQTHLGEFLDPLADKFLMLSSLFSFALFHSPSFAIPAWFLAVLAVREAVLIAGATVMYCLDVHYHVRPTLMGKAAMMLQSLFVLWLFVCHFMRWQPARTYHVVLSLIVVVLLASLGQYVCGAVRFLSRRFGSN